MTTQRFNLNSTKPLTRIISSILTIVCLAPSIANSKVLEVDIVKSAKVNDSQIAFVPFSGDPNLSNMIFSRLESMPMTVTSEGLIGQPHSREDLAATLPAWQQLGIPYLVIGNVKSDSGNTVVNFEVVEVEKGRIIKGNHTLKGSNKNVLANQISARVYELISNKKLDVNAKLLYVEEKGSGSTKTSSLILRNSDGSNPRVLTKVTDASILTPAVSPNGRYIAYPVQLKDHNANIYKYDLYSQSQVPTPIVVSKGSDYGPSFSPDGSTILFASTRDSTADIWRVSSNGGVAEKIIGLPYEQFAPSYAPNGSFVFASDHTNSNSPIIYRYTFSGSYTPINNESNAADPNYSLDGSKIGYLRGKSAAVMDTSGRLIKTFDRTDPEQAPSISPDGERVAYATGNKKSNIIIRFIDGGSPISIPTEGVVRSVKWVPSSDFR